MGWFFLIFFESEFPGAELHVTPEVTLHMYTLGTVAKVVTTHALEHADCYFMCL